MLMVRPKLSQAVESLSKLSCMLHSLVTFRAQSSANRKPLMIVSLTFVTAFKQHWLCSFPVCLIYDADSVLRVMKCILYHSWKASNRTILEQEHSPVLFYSICYSKGFWYVTIILDMSPHAIMKLSHNGDKLLWASMLSQYPPQSISAYSVKGFCQIYKGCVQVASLLLALLL